MRNAFEGSMSDKKKRRSNRRTKQNPPSSSASKVNETSECSGKNGTPTPTQTPCSLINSLKTQEVTVCSPNEEGLSKESNVEFTSLPPMDINDQVQVEPVDLQNMYIGLVPLIPGRGTDSTFSEPTGCSGSSGTNKRRDSVPCFSPHWSVEAVEKALQERDDVFKVVFRVNAHNRLEAYCKIDGVPTDVLIGGVLAQNRAVEGDIVAIQIDSPLLWTKMKGPNVAPNNTAILEGCKIVEDEVGDNNCKGNGKADAESAHCRSSAGQNKEDSDHKATPFRSYAFPEKRYIYEADTLQGSAEHFDALGLASCDSIDGLDSKVKNAVEKMCSLVNSFPFKRPTGKVISVIERSPRRKGIVGLLNVKHWPFFKDISKKDAKKNKNFVSEHGYIQLMPTDPKFPNIILLVRELPGIIMERLKSGDATIEMDLIAAQIDDWIEESPFPKGKILQIFGRGGEVQPQLDAILFQNAICSSEFSPEALSCLPCVPWKLPVKEIQCRTDLRNLCIFTIDPSTATDLDDALSVEKLPNGNYRVGVHIADASYFVVPDTDLDRDARFRSTSVYMLQRKIPMLPALISENIGSLNPGVDRLAVTMLLDINLAGVVVDRWIGRTVIQSCCKLSYEHVQDIIDNVFNFESSNYYEGDYPTVHGCFEWPDLITSLKSLYEISNVLKHKRFTEGALRLDNPKIVILFDEDGIPYDSMFSERKESIFLVEEFMLLANTTAAEVICRAYPDVALLRRHPEPNMRKLREFRAFCEKHGFILDTSSSGHIHWSLEQLKEKLNGDPVLYDILISYATRPMQLASYFCSGDLKDNENEWGHYALAVPLYTHFTSPLRRYPDIIVHRTILAAIEAEEIYMKHQNTLEGDKEVEVQKRWFTGIHFDKKAAESVEGREALSAAALKHLVPSAEVLADIAAYFNERKLASRKVKDACDRLYIWFLLKKKKILLSEARVLGLGPRFMSIYIEKLATERRIYYDEVEGLTTEWLEATSTVVLSMCTNRRAFRRGSTTKLRALEEVALLTCPYDLTFTMDNSYQSDGMDVDALKSAMDRQHIPNYETSETESDGVDVGAVNSATDKQHISKSNTSETEIEPAVFPLTLHLLSAIPIALHAVGGDEGPLDFGVRLYMSSYFGQVGSFEVADPVCN